MTVQHEIHYQSRARWVLYGFLAIAGFFMFTEHRAHVLGISPYLLLLACLLMHLFMHHDHGSQEQHMHNQGSSEGESK